MRRGSAMCRWMNNEEKERDKEREVGEKRESDEERDERLGGGAR